MEDFEKNPELANNLNHWAKQDQELNSQSENLESPDKEIDVEKHHYIPDDSSSEDHNDSRHSVNVKAAEAEFIGLARELSNYSQKTRKTLSRTTSKRQDIEQVLTFSEREPFDLEEVLRGNQQMEQESGIKAKQLGVIWENLNVSGGLAIRHEVETFPVAVWNLFNIYGMVKDWFGIGSKGDEVDILKGFKGLLKPGEMCLVLGAPSSGCTSFLKVIANQRFGYSNVTGDVYYGPFDDKEFARYRGEALYSMEDDVHQAALTVGQTLNFAVGLKSPGKLPAGMSRSEFKQKVIDLLLRMFNIEHTRNTLVGGPFIVGCSGGERKRVSIAEMMVSGACICSHDQSTRGLDASTASDYAKSLRIVSNIYKTSTFVSLYQASETIYNQFDKVLVIDKGRQVYFGPTSTARAYFEGLGMEVKPRATTSDYLVSMTDPYERSYAPGYGPHNAPSTTEEFVKAFEESAHARQLGQEMADYRQHIRKQQEAYEDFKQAHLDAKRKGARAGSVYSSSVFHQIGALMRRQTLLKWQDKFALSVSWGTMILIAIILATTWVKLPLDTPSAFTRGGLLFISLLFNAFQAFGELAGVMVGRALVEKHRGYALYRPSSLWLAQIFVDALFAAAQIMVFSLIVYFSCGLALDAGAFFIFWLMIWTGYLSMTVFFRTVGCLCPNFDTALRSAVLIITLLVTTNGYLIQWNKEQVWLRWIFYINGLGLGFAAMMINEFSRIDFDCNGPSLIPSGAGYNDINHQVCALAGSRAGTDIVSGTAYIAETFNYQLSDLWRNWGIMIALILFFLGMNLIFGELIRWGGGRTVTFFTKETKETSSLNEALAERKQNRKQGKEVDESKLNITSQSVLTWENLCYDVPIGSGHRRLLNNVFGYVQPGKLTALMGQSGAGKTTLLDVLAARKNIGVISGDILVDAASISSSFARTTSYAEQLDVHEPNQSVREALRFSADLRQPYETPQAEKYAYVEEIISLLELEPIADAIIGSPEAGLAVEARKRVTIGVELAAKPELLLFLDEPTSGLDSTSAWNIVRFLRKLAASGQAILCTIHQPNSALFESFDRLLLLQAGGECVYFGDIGKDAYVLREYFARHGAFCPSDANPAEWMLDAIGAGLQARLGEKDWGQVWRESPEFEVTKSAIIDLKEERHKAVRDAPVVIHSEYASPLWHQIKVVFHRTNRSFWRSPPYTITRIWNHAILALLAGLVFLQLNDSLSSLQNRVFVIFQITVLPALIISQVEPRFEMSRLIFYRESSAKAYGQFSFALTQVLAEIPYSIICAVSFFIFINYLPGLQYASDRSGYQFLMILIVEFFSVTLGQMLSALTPSTNISMRLNPPVIITFALYCGVTIPAPQMPAFWRAWLYELDPFTRLVSGSVTTELEGRAVNCQPSEFQRVAPPSGQTCGDYFTRFFEEGGLGYLANNASTTMCEYCAYKSGDEFYTRLGLSFDNRWRDLGIMAAFIGSNLIILFLASRYLNFNRR